MNNVLKMAPGFDLHADQYRQHWIAFAAAALSGLNAFPGLSNGAYLSDEDCVKRAAEQADWMLAELKKRLAPE